MTMKEENLSEMSDSDLLNLYHDMKWQVAAMEAKQMGLKICLNSLYGATGNRHFTDFFDIRVAGGITSSGRLAIKWIMTRVDVWLKAILKTDISPIIAGDTDSMYITLDPLLDLLYKGDRRSRENYGAVTDVVDAIVNKKLIPFIDKCFTELAEYANAAEQRMFMKRETIAPVAIWTVKKRYVMAAMDVEGVRYHEPKIKFTGLDAKRSTIPKPCRKWLAECYGVALFHGEKEVQDFVKKTKVSYKALPLSDIVKTSGVTSIEKYMGAGMQPIKGTPAHVKACIAHNRLLANANLPGIRPIQAGDKVSMIDLKAPNPAHVPLIAFQGRLPPEFGLEQYIDYEVSFTGNFVKPLENLIKHLGWSPFPKASVTSLFG